MYHDFDNNSVIWESSRLLEGKVHNPCPSIFSYGETVKVLNSHKDCLSPKICPGIDPRLLGQFQSLEGQLQNLCQVHILLMKKY